MQFIIEIGDNIKSYLILKELIKNQKGSIYEVFDEKCPKKAVIKVYEKYKFKQHDKATLRVKREFDIISSFENENILKFFEY